jgi:hypothetical protein
MKPAACSRCGARLEPAPEPPAPDFSGLHREAILSGPANMLLGGLWCGGGITITVVTYMAAAEHGGVYIIAYGAIISGGLQFLHGIRQILYGDRITPGFDVPWWSLVRGLLFAGVAACCAFIGLGFIVSGIEQRSAAERVHATAQPVALAQLLEKGPGTNLHLELQQFTVGEAVIEKAPDESWTCVWVPLTPTRTPAKSEYKWAVWRTSTIRDPEQLDALRREKSLTLLCTSGFDDGLDIKVEPSDTLRKQRPKYRTAETVFFTDREAFDTSRGYWLWTAGGLLCVFGFLLIVQILVGGRQRASA